MLNRIIFFVISCVLIILAGCTGPKTQEPVITENETVDYETVLLIQAEKVMKAFYFAYPDRISNLEFFDGDWTFHIDGKRFFYAEGRILPEEHRNRASEYGALLIWSNYTAELPWEDAAEQRQMIRPRGAFRSPRSNYLYEAIWNISNQNEASRNQVRINFLGRALTINSEIRERINRIEKIILDEAKTNPDVRKWMDSLGTVEGYTWRSVASSGSRSFHAYGLAVDLLPGNLGGKATYWLWSSQHNPQWWNIPYSERYHPPDEVIKTFESFGFIWGGKWRQYFDTMHFEYRPEVFILSGVSMSNFYLWNME